MDGILYFQVTDPRLASYGTSDYVSAITQLAQTTLRSVIGKMEKVAEKYIEAFAHVAKEGNTLILPGNLADLGGLVATAMSIVKNQQ